MKMNKITELEKYLIALLKSSDLDKECIVPVVLMLNKSKEQQIKLLEFLTYNENAPHDAIMSKALDIVKNNKIIKKKYIENIRILKYQ